MDVLKSHYRQLLGLNASWIVTSVDLDVQRKRVVIEVEHVANQVTCPQCSQACSIYDHAPLREWRHLDTMQFETIIQTRVPRCKCADCGVKTNHVPWAQKYSRFTVLFEAFVIDVLKAASSVKSAALLLGLDWDSVHSIMKRAVDRGLYRREVDQVKHVGLDEKSFRRGQDYVSLLTDLDGSRVLEVVPGRTEAAADQLWETLPQEQISQIEAVAIDMSQAYENSVRNKAPQAAIVYDKFHISKHLNEAVDQVRRQEQKVLKEAGDRRLTGTKQLWLYNPMNLRESQRDEFETLKHCELKTSRAWAIKESFRWFWTYCYAGRAKTYFKNWYSWAIRSRLKPIKKVAKMLQRRLPNVLTYFKHRITNAISEGFNSRIQALKANARGFRNFDNYRVRILFFCGHLDFTPGE